MSKVYTPWEFSAILVYKYYKSKEKGERVSIEDAIEGWEQEGFPTRLRNELVKQDNDRQIIVIRDYAAELEKKGKNKEEAMEEATKLAPIARAILENEKYELVQNRFSYMVTDVKNEKGIHLRPSNKLAAIAKGHDCDLFITKDSISDAKVRLKFRYGKDILEKTFVNINDGFPVLNFAQLGAVFGEKLGFLAYGNQAEPALDSVYKEINNPEPT